MPTGLLFLAVSMCLATTFFLKNHSRMTEGQVEDCCCRALSSSN